jgi:hypothetical protein
MGTSGLQLAHNCPENPGIRVTGFRITEGPLYVAACVSIIQFYFLSSFLVMLLCLEVRERKEDSPALVSGSRSAFCRYLLHLCIFTS